MNMSLWVGQFLLAVFFIFMGALKLFMPLDSLAEQMPWVNDVPSALVRFIGFAELAGGLGLILPAITKILPWLTTLAAAGLSLIMAFATVFTFSRGEFTGVILNMVLLTLALLIAYGRWKRVPIAARS